MAECVILLDENTQVILDVNTAGLAILGVSSKDQVVGRAISQWIEPSFRDDFAHALRVAGRRCDPRRFDAIWRAADGQNLAMEVSAGLVSPNEPQTTLQIVARRKQLLSAA